MVDIKGYYRSGANAAKKNLINQAEMLGQEFPEIVPYTQHGTINVQFEPHLLVVGSDYRTKPIKWDKNNPEVFDFVRVRVRISDLNTQAPGFIYIAHRSDHRKDPHMHELLVANHISGLQVNMPVEIRCDRKHVELPYEAVDMSSGRPCHARVIVIL
jgi:hypothetical protein